jgi:hypothetical protein
LAEGFTCLLATPRPRAGWTRQQMLAVLGIEFGRTCRINDNDG